MSEEIDNRKPEAERRLAPVSLLAEMNRHIEQLITMKAESEVIRCAVNDRHALMNEPVMMVQGRIEPIRRWWQLG